MQINNNEIVTYSYIKKASDKDISTVNNADISNIEPQKLLSEEIFDTFETSGDTQLVTYEITSPPAKTETDKIKQILYRLNHNNNANSKTITDTNTSTTYSMDNAYDLLKYTSTRTNNDSINIINGITREQLYKFTQDDDMEDNNAKFFGKLFSAFDDIDTQKDSDSNASNDILTYDELNAYLGNIKGDSALDSKIEAYSQKLQNEFKQAANGGNTALLNWVTDKAKDYMQASGLTKQLEALERLQSKNLISLGDCNNGKDISEYFNGGTGWILGAYNSYQTPTHQWVDDHSLKLDEQYYNPNKNPDLQWYDMVGTLIHELTHATNQKYSGVQGSGNNYYSGTQYDLSDYAFAQLKNLYDNNLLSDNDKALYNSYINSNGTGFVNGITDTNKQKIIDIINTFWLECSAYQADEDYEDSIGKGDSKGADEKSATIQHIKEHYINNTNSPYQPGTGVNDNYGGDWWVTYKGKNFTYEA